MALARRRPHGTWHMALACLRSEREEEFYQISVDVKGCGSLEKSLEG